ncbi:MAG: GC-type dockerin domain-anchored protein [Phycisphaerales bacterium]
MRSTTSAVLCLLLTAGTALAGNNNSNPGQMPDMPMPAAAQQFLAQHDGARFYWTGDRITSVYGKAFGTGVSARGAADAFVAQNAALFGVAADDLVAGSLASDGAAERQIMPDLETGKMKFTLVSYLQQRQGLNVFRGDLRLLVREEDGFPVVLARSALAPLGNFTVDQNALNNPNVTEAMEQADLRVPGFDSVSDEEMVIWAGTDKVAAAKPALAFKFVVTRGHAGDENYSKYLLLADAKTGQIVYSEDLVTHVDVNGNVSGIITPGKKAADCATEVQLPMPYARVAIGSTVAYADVNGNFTIANSGSSAVTVVSGVRGKWFRVFNPSADAPTISTSVTPPGPVNFLHNSANNNETRRGEVNAYYNSNVVRDMVLSYNANFPTIKTQTEFRVNVAVSGTCNAYYDGASINFYSAGGGCSNTAYGDVVWHEYGHHVVACAGSSQDQYGEGYGDLLGVVISDDPILGYGFYLNVCNSGIRTAANNHQYPCSGEIHDCGQLLTGCWWSTRNILIGTDPSTYQSLLKNWAVNSVLVHTGGSITPQITIDVLTLDDNNANISDGTPHYNQIAQGFGDHNMDAPPLDPFDFAYPSGKPANINPAGGSTADVKVTAKGSFTLSTVKMYVDPEGDGTYAAVNASSIGGGVYRVTFPAATCGNTVKYYFTATATNGTIETDPSTAPATTYSTFSGNGLITAFADNFETDTGWTISTTASAGGWQRGVPVAGGNAPSADADGSGKCYVTGNTASVDVDGGQTVLTSPTFNGSAGNVYLQYSRWYKISGAIATDAFSVEASNNNGATWTPVESVAAGSSEASGGWYAKQFQLSSILPLSATMKVRFTARDTGIDNNVEAGIDAFKILTPDCGGGCEADFNGDGFVNGDDYDAFAGEFEVGSVAADVNGDGFVNGDDFDYFAGHFEGGC